MTAISITLTAADYVLSPIGDAIDSGIIVRRWWDTEGLPMARYAWRRTRPYLIAAAVVAAIAIGFWYGVCAAVWRNRDRVLTVDRALEWGFHCFEWAFQCGDCAGRETVAVVDVLPVVVEDEPSLEDLFNAVNEIMAQPSYAERDFSAMTVKELRAECKERGIKCRHAHGRNRHLSKAEMVAALSA